MSSRTQRFIVVGILVVTALWWWRQQHWDSPPPPAARPDATIDVQAVTDVEPKPIRSQSSPTPAATAAEASDQTDEPGVSPHARQIRGELKLVLSGIYSAEKAFFSEAGRFSTDFDVLGWMPLARELKVKAGFLYPYSPPPDEFRDRGDRFDTDQLVEASQVYDDPQSRMVYAETARKVSLRTLGSYCEMNCTADAKGFEVIAAANLDEDDDLEIWRINDRKELVQVFDDVKGIAPPPRPSGSTGGETDADSDTFDEGPLPPVDIESAIPEREPGEPAEDFRPSDEPPSSWPDETPSNDEP